jgi:Ca2+-binding RTX toxin-like protein
MNHRASNSLGLRPIILAAALAVLALPAATAHAGFLEGTPLDDVLIGSDDDNVNNPLIQPPGDVPNQSLDDTDVFNGGPGDDVLIGLKGDDVMRGGPGNDILVGGTEGGVGRPNSDVMFGDEGDDISLWRGGDGSDAVIGGRGLDAEVFGTIDREGLVPILSPATGRHRETGLPTADLTGQGGFCTLEDIRGSDLGYEFLARFFVRATGALAVTVRLVGVEQMFCTSEAGGAITFADLTVAEPQLVEVSLDEVAALNRTVRQIIR